jgi:TPR repeat protein
VINQVRREQPIDFIARGETMTGSRLPLLVILLSAPAAGAASPGEIGGGVSRVGGGTGAGHGLTYVSHAPTWPGEAAYQRALHVARYDGAAASVAPLERAVAEGSPPAMTTLGLMLVRGEGVAPDEGRGLGLIGQAADKGDPAAMLALARAFYNGDGVQRDERLARLWLVRAAETGYRPAMEARRRLAAR